MMLLGIDASNIRGGGGVTHLAELLQSANPPAHGFEKVVVWGRRDTLAKIEERAWLVKSHQTTLDSGLLKRVYWQFRSLPKLARDADCDVLFFPGGVYAGSVRPFVTMSRNLLPFEWRELLRFGWSLTTIRMMLLRWAQSRTFRRADGLIFLTRYARDAVIRVIRSTSAMTAIIPHGIGHRFAVPVREQLPINQYSRDKPYRILYVSTIEFYKHQWLAAEAVAKLRSNGLPIMLELVGPAYSAALGKLEKAINELDPSGEYVRYSGDLPYHSLHEKYAEADLFLFASSCENMPNILLEAMAAGLPIACSNCGPMPEVLGDAGEYFDPEDADDIARALKTCIDSADLRGKMANASSRRVQGYSWQRCADETFAFLAQIADTHTKHTKNSGQPGKQAA